MHLQNWFGLVHRLAPQLIGSLLGRWALEIAVELFANLILAAFACQLIATEPLVFDLVADSVIFKKNHFQC